MTVEAKQNPSEPPRPGLSPSMGQRAAVVIAMLGEEAARPIIEKLDDAALSKVVAALDSVALMARDELVDIIADFLGHLGKSAGTLLHGKAEARDLISRVVAQRAELSAGEANGLPDTSAGAVEDTWSRFAKRDAVDIAAYLSRLTPNLMAMLLRRLPVTATSDVLCHISDDQLQPVMGHLVQRETTDPGIDRVLERMVEMEFLNNVEDASQTSNEHLETVGELLSLIPASKRENLVDFLENQHKDELENIQKSLFTIETLPDILPRATVPVIFRELDMTTTVDLIASTQSAFPAVAEFLLGNLSSRMADQIRDEVSRQEALTPEASEDVQRSFLTTLMNLKRKGLITLLE